MGMKIPSRMARLQAVRDPVTSLRMTMLISKLKNGEPKLPK